MKIYFLGFFLLFAYFTKAQEIIVSHYQLDNGLTVIINEDHSQPAVFGCVVVRAGSKDDPEDATGLAHYMEHVMFKGTGELGTSDWESEKPHYEKIINLYEELRATADPVKKKEINNQINEESVAAGKYAIPNEFSNLIQGIGGTGLNAATSYDFTMYYNSLPPFQIRRWLDIYAHRFINPVFRGFQTELETVYEEKNMYSDNPSSAVMTDFLVNMFGEDDPYGRQVIGKTEHLKNPSIKRIIEFYNAFYVPSNMALILSGDLKPDELKAMIEDTFGKWEKREQTGKSKELTNVRLSGVRNVKRKLTPYPMLLIGFPAVPKSDPDEYALEFCSRMLSNDNSTGLLDKLVIEGDLMGTDVMLQQLKYAGLLAVQAVPTFDVNQMKFVSLGVIEKMINKEIEKLKKGEFEDWLVDAFKNELYNEYDKMFESSVNTGITLVQNFVYEEGIDDLLNYKKKIEAVTKEDIIKAANKYLTDNRLIYLSDIGEPKKDELKKSEYKPIEPAPGGRSAYAASFEKLPFSNVGGSFVDFKKDIQEKELAEKVKLFYTPNPKNDIFSLTIKFGIGAGKIPTLGMAAQLMNYAGVLAQYKPQELKMEYSKLGCSVDFFCTDSYLYIVLEGNEQNLADACQLLSRTFLLPQLDEKQMNNVKGGVIGSRSIEKSDKDAQSSALRNYLIYGENSPELTRLPDDKIRSLTISNLTSDFVSATHYETSVHYAGGLRFEEVSKILTGNLAFPSNLQTSNSPYVRPLANNEKESILFLNNPDARQSEIFLFVEGSEYQLEDQPVIDAFNQYFGGGFNGLVLQELRERRSFAYTASAGYRTPELTGKLAYLVGSIGTQADKTADAVAEFVHLIREMPSKPERIENIRNYLMLTSQSSKPDFRNLSQMVEYWRKKGYQTDPNQLFLPVYQQLSFDGIQQFYEKEIANKPIVIAIVGNKEQIDMEKLESIAKVEKVSTSKLFKN